MHMAVAGIVLNRQHGVLGHRQVGNLSAARASEPYGSERQPARTYRTILRAFAASTIDSPNSPSSSSSNVTSTLKSDAILQSERGRSSGGGQGEWRGAKREAGAGVPRTCSRPSRWHRRRTRTRRSTSTT